MTEQISIRKLTTMPDLNATVELQRAVWGMRDVEVSSPHTLRAIVHSGGAVMGALAGECLVGFCCGFAALRAGELWLWSHMAAVHPNFQGMGIGYRLKQAQRAWALAAGYRRMAWTFDPMQAGNANFNFNRLGVTARRYSANHYGDMQDGLNAGLASDRLEAQWQLDSPRVIAMAEPGYAENKDDWPAALTMVVLEKRGALLYRPPPVNGEQVLGIEIPPDIAELKRTDIKRAQQWQQQVRAAMIALLAAGYVVNGFLRLGGSSFYTLGWTD